MKILLFCLLLSLGLTVNAMDAEDKEILSHLDGESYTHILKTPRGNLKGIMVFRKHGIIGIAAKKDLLMGVRPKQMKIFKKGSRSSIKPDMVDDGKNFGLIFARDPKNTLGEPINLTNNQSAQKAQVFRINGKSPHAVKIFQLSKNKKYAFMFLGKIRLGMLSGKVTAAGKKGKAKYKIFKNFPLGAIVARINGNPIGSPVYIGGNSTHSKNVAAMVIKGQSGMLDFIINDAATKNNKGEFFIMTQI